MRARDGAFEDGKKEDPEQTHQKNGEWRHEPKGKKQQKR
jgi:hypothetical protein